MFDSTYFTRLAKAVKALGRYTRTSERKKYGLNMSKRRYPTLEAFVRKAVELGKVEDLFEAELHEPHHSHLMVQPQLEIVSLVRKALRDPSRMKRPVPPIPLETARSKWERTGLSGFPYAPHEEQGVLALFSILCAERILNYKNSYQ